MEVLLLISAVLLGISLFFNYNQYQRGLNLEQIIREFGEEQNKLSGSVFDFMEHLLEVYVKVLAKLERIDRNGAFATDDEVGFVFNTLKDTIEDLKGYLDDLFNKLKSEETVDVSEEKEKA